MTDTAGFYKLDGMVFYAPNFVLNKNYELRRATHELNTYPVDGWYWFDDEVAAYEFFGVELPAKPEEEIQ